MTTLTQLIEHHCPNGVEYVELKEVLKYEQPSKYLVSSTDYDDGFSTAVLTAGKTFILGYTDETTGIYEASPDDPVIIFDDFTTAFKWVDFPFKAKSSAMKMLTPAVVDSSFRYIFYAMHDVDVDVTDHKRQWIRTYSKEKIPLPPYEVQDAIVERLDAFAALIESLDSEITLREKRFEYFREQLLNFDESDGVDYVKLEDVFELGSGYTPSRKNTQYWENGSIPWFRMDDIRTNGRILSNSLEKITPEAVKGGRLFPGNSVILSTSATIGEHAIVTTDFMCNQRFHVLVLRETFTERVHPRFVYYVGFSLGEYCREHVNEGNFKTVSSAAFKAFPFPLPPYEVQDTIIDKLDTMQALIDNLKQERELRRTQFAYYREKLLTFNS